MAVDSACFILRVAHSAFTKHVRKPRQQQHNNKQRTKAVMKNNNKTMTVTNDKYLGLTEAEFKRFDRACHATWQYIAGDLMQCVAENGGGDSIPRNEVIECVLDAGRLLQHGEGHVPFRRGKVKLSEMTDWERFYHKRLNQWIQDNYHLPRFLKLMKEVFPFDRYE